MASAPRNLLTDPPRTPLVAASILAADFARMGEEADDVLSAGADLIHFDVMDGHFVPNLTMGPDLCRALRRVLPRTCFDVHLMVEEPQRFVRPFAEAGASHLTFHVESAAEPGPLIDMIHDLGLTAGIALNPATDAARVLPWIEPADLVLVMSVNPGYAGQRFIPDVLAKAAEIAPRLRGDQRLEIDGGINAETAPAARDAGFDCLVAASAIFGSADYAAAVGAIRGRSSKVSPDRPGPAVPKKARTR